MIRWSTNTFANGFLCIILGFLLACEKDVPNVSKRPIPQNFRAVFDTFWLEMNTNYVFWDIDSTNWDEVYKEYEIVFSQLDLNNSDDVRRSVQYFRKITDRLVDSHYYIKFLNPLIKDSIVYPSYYRKIKTANFHASYPYAVLDAMYLDSSYVSGYDSTSEPTKLKYALSGLINSDIIFFYCNEFTLFQSYYSNTSNGIKPVLSYFFLNVENPPPNIKAIIVDFRGNQGGYLNDLFFFVSRFINKPLKFGWTRYRSGNGRLDYTPWIEATVRPTRSIALKIPIIVLVDSHTGSLSEIITMALRSLPNCLVVGEPTWGATGQVAPYEIYNSGSFTVPNFMDVEASSVEFKYIDNQIYEGKGFSPDIFVPFNRDSIFMGIDTQLESAIGTVR